MNKIGKSYDLFFLYLYVTDGLFWVRFWWLNDAWFYFKNSIKHPPLFSERIGKRKSIKIGNYRILKLKGR